MGLRLDASPSASFVRKRRRTTQFVLSLAITGAILPITCLSLPIHSASNSNAPRRSSIFPNSRDISVEDLQVLIRQTGQNNAAAAAIGIPCDGGCRHGFAQVFALDPVPNEKRINSGLIKLTCPLLVRAVDELEDEGFIAELNGKLVEGLSEDHEESLLQNCMREAHQLHASVRRDLIHSTEDRNMVLSKLGERGARAFWAAGVAAASPGAVSDVKCLHAWLGDYLFRGSEASPIGAIVAQILNDRGIDLTGTADCRPYCDPEISASAASPPTPRNKQRLRTNKELARRRRQKESKKVIES